MPPERVDQGSLTALLPEPALWAVAVLAAAGWHLLHRRWRIPGSAGGIVRIVTGTLCLLAFLSAAGRHLLLATTVPLWVWSLVGASAVEAVVVLYATDRRQVDARTGRLLVALRVTAVLSVLTILVQPVFSRIVTRHLQRTVVILADESESMQLTDGNPAVSELLEMSGRAAEDLPGRLIAAASAYQTRCEEIAGRLSREDAPVPPATAEELTALAAEVDEWAGRLRTLLEEDAGQLPEPLERSRPDVLRLLGVNARNALVVAVRRAREGQTRPTRLALREAVESLGGGLAAAGPLADALDERYWSRLPEDERERILAGAFRPRRELAAGALTQPVEDGRDLLTALRGEYDVRTLQFGRTVREAEGPGGSAPDDAPWRSRTDITTALEYVKANWTPGSLAGVILLTDARHNGPRPPDGVARALGLQGAPVSTVLAGSRRGMRDAAIAGVAHPQTVFLGDHLRVDCDVRITGMRGEMVTVQLLRDGREVASRILEPDTDAFRQTVRLSDLPETAGVHSWEVRIAELPDEQFDRNNWWGFEAAVSDDRIHVLLVDERPRWEFRYLRNLFEGRDKSVHLQHVLTHPDTIDGAAPRPLIPADAGRPFGEAEATALPAREEAWAEFDVIILGDVSPGTLTDERWEIVRRCVVERGALLVLIAGRNAMPGAYLGSAAADLIPVKAGERADGDEPFRFALTGAGRTHSLFEAPGNVPDREGWERFPPMTWRFRHGGVREGTEILAWAAPVNAQAAPDSGGDPATLLQRRRLEELQRALIIEAAAGHGKVVFLTTDQTWRFRYGIGDTWHHRFWGNLLRGGAGENLAAGSGGVRMGLDRFAMEPGEAVRVTARLTDENRRPVANGRVEANVILEGRTVRTLPLRYREGSRGIHEAVVEGLQDEGRYRIELAGADVDRLLAGGPGVGMELTVGGARNSVEIGDVRPDPEAAERWAAASGGLVTGVTDAGRLLPVFGPGSRDIPERRNTTLWDHWLLLSVAVGAVTAEWILRRRRGLV